MPIKTAAQEQSSEQTGNLKRIQDFLKKSSGAIQDPSLFLHDRSALRRPTSILSSEIGVQKAANSTRSVEIAHSIARSAIAEPDEAATRKNPTAQKEPRTPRYRYTCSKAFRDVVLQHYPMIRDNVAYMRFMAYLLFSGVRDWKQDHIPIPQLLLASFEEREKQCRAGNYRALDLLRRFQRDVLPAFTWRNQVAGERPRTVKNLGLCEEILRAAEIELSTPVSDLEDRVYFVSGKRFTRREQGEIRSERQRAVKAKHQEALCKASRRLLEYMNSLPSNRFRKVFEHVEEAYRAILGIQNPNERKSALQTLRAIQDHPQPFYQPSENSVRVWSDGASLLTLNKKLRRILTQDWTELDLRSSQLAICSVLWDVPSVQAFLRDGGQIWDSLIAYLGIDVTKVSREVVKEPLKRGMYAVLFGGSKSRISREVNQLKQFGVKNPSDKFYKHPVIQAMYEAREVQLERIVRDGGAYDCFGRWLSMEQVARSSKKEKPERSILAQLAQAKELQILLPVFDLAESTDEFQIMLWQHDGFSVAFKNATKKDRWTRQIVDVVNASAAELGIPTELEIS